MNRKDSLQSFLLCLVSLVCLLGVRGATGEEGERTWTSVEGRQLRASLVEVKEEAAILRLGTGELVRVPLSRLSKADREFLLQERFADAFEEHIFVDGREYPRLPDSVSLPDEIEVTGGPDRYYTANFSFETDLPVSKAFISEASKIYEGTFQALHAIPHGLKFRPPEGREYFAGAFLREERFNRIAADRMASIPGQRVVGLYLSDEQRLLVPYSSLGAEKLGSRMTLRKRSDTTTLVHEIVHQVMHRYLPVLPTWFSEGLAEYISSVPYQNGRFDFRNAERGLKERLKESYGKSGRTVEGVRRPSSFLGHSWEDGGEVQTSVTGLSGRKPTPSESGKWQGTVHEYRDALLLVYFFMHLDRLVDHGEFVGHFLAETDAAMNDAAGILEEYRNYETARLAYNEEVQHFNDSLDAYASAAKAYNRLVETYNDQLKSGVPESERVAVGEPPSEPERPEELKFPEELSDLMDESRRIDLVALVERRALDELLHGRSPDWIDESMEAAYKRIGIVIQYHP